MRSRSVTVNQVEFRGVSDVAWPRPPKGGSSPVALALRITNRGETPLRFKLIDTLFLSLRAAEGSELRYKFARDATPREGWFSPPLPPGKTFDLLRPAKLEWQADGSLRLSGPDGFGGLWWFEGLRAGKYTLGFRYRSDAEKADEHVAAWRGEAQLPGVTIAVP